MNDLRITGLELEAANVTLGGNRDREHKDAKNVGPFRLQRERLGQRDH